VQEADGDRLHPLAAQRLDRRQHVRLGERRHHAAVGGQALAHLEAQDVGIIISDFLMPEMDGISFLTRARELRPDVPRVLLTGYADKENAIKAINQVALYQYVEKPWDNDDLRLIIRNGLEKRRLVAKLSEQVSQINQAYLELRGIQEEILKAFA
jgi:DNA-binding NtrC family response regulator